MTFCALEPVSIIEKNAVFTGKARLRSFVIIAFPAFVLQCTAKVAVTVPTRLKLCWLCTAQCTAYQHVHVLCHCVSEYILGHCCRLTGRVGVKLSNGSIAYSAEQVTAGSASPKPASSSSSFSSSARRQSLEQAAKPFYDDQTHRLPAASQSQSQAPVGILSRLSGSVSRAAPQRLLPGAELSTDHLHRLQTEPVSKPIKSSVSYVQYEDQDEDDALDALQELDALLMPASLTRCKAPSVSVGSPSSVLRDTMKYQHSPTARRSSARAHTSTTDRAKVYSPSQTRAVTHTSASYSAVQDLWTPDRDEQHSASKSAHSLWTAGKDQQCSRTGRSSPVPVRILKRPNIATGPCSPDAVSPPLAGPSAQSLSRTGNSGQFAADLTTPSDLLSDAPRELQATVSTAALGTAGASADTTVQSSSTSLVNERLRSQSVLKLLQRQQQEQSSLSIVPSDNSKSTEHAELRSEIKSTPVVRAAAAVAAAAAASKSEQAVARSSDSSTSNASSQSAATAHAVSGVVPPRSSSPVDDLVLELQVQHLMDKVPGLAPAMAGFAIEVCLNPYACCSPVACFGCCQFA